MVDIESCSRCNGKRFTVELSKDEKSLYILCISCDNFASLPVDNIEGFDVDCWNDYCQRDGMYQKLDKLFTYWNDKNYHTLELATAL